MILADGLDSVYLVHEEYSTSTLRFILPEKIPSSDRNSGMLLILRAKVFPVFQSIRHFRSNSHLPLSEIFVEPVPPPSHVSFHEGKDQISMKVPVF